MRVEAGLRSIATLDAAGNDAAKKIALQNTFRRQAKCGVQGHWQKDKMFKAVDIQKKAARDASMQYQQQWAASGSYSGQPMQQYGYGAPARLAMAAAGYAGPSGMGGGGQQGGVAGQQMGPGGGATLALTHHNQAPASGAGN